MCKYCNPHDSLFSGLVFDTCICNHGDGWYMQFPNGIDIPINYCPFCGNELSHTSVTTNRKKLGLGLGDLVHKDDILSTCKLFQTPFIGSLYIGIDTNIKFSSTLDELIDYRLILKQYAGESYVVVRNK